MHQRSGTLNFYHVREQRRDNKRRDCCLHKRTRNRIPGNNASRAKIVFLSQRSGPRVSCTRFYALEYPSGYSDRNNPADTGYIFVKFAVRRGKTVSRENSGMFSTSKLLFQFFPSFFFLFCSGQRKITRIDRFKMISLGIVWTKLRDL